MRKRHAGIAVPTVLIVAVAVMAFAASASAQIAWSVGGKALAVGTEKTLPAKPSSGELTFVMEVGGKEYSMVCREIEVQHGSIFNASVRGQLAGRGHEDLKVSHCTGAGELGSGCNTSNPESRMPPTAEYGESVLAEREHERIPGPKVDDLLPEANGRIAEFAFSGVACPLPKKVIVKSTLTVGKPSEASEGNGGLLASVAPESKSLEKTIELPSSTSTWQQALNAHDKLVETDQLGAYNEAGERLGSAKIYGSVKTGLSSLEEWALEGEAYVKPVPVWTVEGKTLASGSEEKLEAKLKAGTEADVPLVLGEIPGEVRCKTLHVENGEILNGEAGSVGWSKGTIVLEECKLVGELATRCALTSTSTKEIKLPPTEAGTGVLVEGGAEPGDAPILADFLPEAHANTLALFGLMKVTGKICPSVQIKINTSLPVGTQGKSNEGEGGIAASISGETEATSHIFAFPKTTYKKAFTWGELEIALGSFTANQEGNLVAEIEIKLASGKKWGVK